jgi:hypothetical protein
MEKPKLTKEDLEKLERQYDSLTEELEIYRQNMRGIKYRKNYPSSEKRKHRHQFKFLKFSLNEAVNTMVIHDYGDFDLLSDALRNRFLTFRTKWIVLKKIYNDISILKK